MTITDVYKYTICCDVTVLLKLRTLVGPLLFYLTCYKSASASLNILPQPPLKGGR